MPQFRQDSSANHAETKDDSLPSPSLNEELFRSAITRERKRTERSGLGIVLVVIRWESPGQTAASPDVWKAIDEALRTVKSEVDLFGWFEYGIAKGLLVPDIDLSKLTGVCERLIGNIRKALSDRVEGEKAASLSFRLRVYPEPMRSEEQASQSIDSYLFPELDDTSVRIIGYDLFKRWLDIVGSLTLLVLLAPLLAAVALSVKVTSRGPILFRQVRIGQMMRPFTILKFRTMRADADPGIHHHYVSWFITTSDKDQAQAKNQVFKLTSDPRITPIGHFLRKTSLDELPQLWNVLKGEMSLVGPRPPLWYELQQYKPWHRYRLLEVKPGITGLWQVSGRSRTTFEEMVRLDLRYAKERSLWTDIKILLATPKAVISGKGAW